MRRSGTRGRLTFGQSVLSFYDSLRAPGHLPAGVSPILPPTQEEVRKYREMFFQRYFNDHHKRVFVIGVNPGRFGSGETGIPFTDPVALQDACGVDNDLRKRRELSSSFIYRVIERLGGARVFYKSFYLTAASPIGFVSGGKNQNYYDSSALLKRVTPFIARSLREQCDIGAKSQAVILGKGLNYQNMAKWNEELGLFSELTALEHPRFIMQYRRNELAWHVERYCEVLTQTRSLRSR